MNIPETETIRFKDSQAAFAIGLDCQENGRFKAADVFKLESRYVIYKKDKSRPIESEYYIWSHDSMIARGRESFYYFFDGTFTKPKGFSKF